MKFLINESKYSKFRKEFLKFYNFINFIFKCFFANTQIFDKKNNYKI